MNHILLDDLVVALCGLPANSGFSMYSWAKYNLPKEKSLTCGTSACAIGLASTLPSWQERGLHLVHDVERGLVQYYKPEFRGLEHYDAVAAALGIPVYEARYMFDPIEYDDIGTIKPHHVVARIMEIKRKHY